MAQAQDFLLQAKMPSVSWACTTFLGSHFCLRLYKQMSNEVLVNSASKAEWNPCIWLQSKSLPLLICNYSVCV